MQALTALVLAAFVGYGASWYFGVIDGNFALLLFMATVVTGLYWLAERYYFLPQRLAAAATLEQASAAQRADHERRGLQSDNVDLVQARERLVMQPWWLDWTAGMFPVILAVFLLRSFLFEPFKIPSGSMIPTLLVGDLILVNKFEYGLRLPVLHTKITQGHAPQRGDVMVFRYPPKPSLDYIKRVVGLPGDEVAYLNKRLTINGQPVSKTSLPSFLEVDSMQYSTQFEEALGGKKHLLLNYEGSPAYIRAEPHPGSENCRYSIEGVVCKVPAGHYFMMGDNRDNSLDSRYWGFVPEENIVGKAILIWMNFADIKRVGSFK
ncbi:MAG: signal peptidase I [Betaproteobacteria bacterium]